MKSLVVANQKGGVGKSTVACILAHFLVGSGKRVLALDADHQMNFTRPLQKSGKAAVTTFRSAQLYETPWDLLETQGARIPSGNLVLIPGDADLLLQLERQGTRHNDFANNMRGFMHAMSSQFDYLIIDTNPNPDIRVVSVLVSTGYVLAPIQLNQEAIDGIGSLMNHPRVGINNIKKQLNPELTLLGLLPNLVEPTPFQKQNFEDIVTKHAGRLIRFRKEKSRFAFFPRRSAIAESQAEGKLLWEMRKTAARAAWHEIEPSVEEIVAHMNSGVNK